MIDSLLVALVFLAALGAGLIAGLFFAFSSFVMDALGRLKPEAGIAAMQSINVAVLNPLFFVAFFGTAGVCVLLALAISSARPGRMFSIVSPAARFTSAAEFSSR